ncbi:hypothetical protein AU374_05844 [Cupriavidus metallidurans]|nr:hypothetical protein AU374_05844 [Cupriavidus metallidurans]
MPCILLWSMPCIEPWSMPCILLWSMPCIEPCSMPCILLWSMPCIEPWSMPCILLWSMPCIEPWSMPCIWLWSIPCIEPCPALGVEPCFFAVGAAAFWGRESGVVSFAGAPSLFELLGECECCAHAALIPAASRAATAIRVYLYMGSGSRLKRVGSGHKYFAEHPGIHVQHKMAVPCPAAQCVGGYEEADPLRRLDRDGMSPGLERTVRRL